ncbi:spermidine/putrescine ABC transporter ATP-binding protein [Arthrobacter sp. AQ5-05]|uniref:ABC transporter ATP-binding protein n=1 Tax=Arthrobacter sp. AQ5-05 TaxID=2184581 RepID=UPI000DCF5FFB|nr:ABC transporter ATP-binding protein [Arthrobacter sp. AQ5-05]RAX48623.1 spermidine/putrescine ABC transporter ATP-binding protein [Arthrobacter sp. AQ5-05]
MPATATSLKLPVQAESSRTTPAISLQQVGKSFGDFHAVKGLDLDIRTGEFFSLLGPSGSGKTTVLRMIAGFELPTSGRIELGGLDVTNAAPFERDVNTVFQDYALFPHLTVAQNVEYGLKLRKLPKAERARRVAEALEMIQLPQVARRLPSQLSGGQRQRIALARALVLRPQVLLLDEPLGALDKQLREQMQIELKAIQRDVGITFVFVTHDQEEALTLSDRVAVFNEGKIDQVGSPSDLYERPATRFVASFLGNTNLIEGALAQELTGSPALVSLRPEHIVVRPLESVQDSGTSAVTAVIEEIVYTGPTTRYMARTDHGTQLIVQEQNGASSAAAARGTRVRLEWPSRYNYTV